MQRNHCGNVNCCCGPQGPMGPQGPVGPANGLNAYGGRYSSTIQTLILAPCAETQVGLPATMAAKAVAYTPVNGMTVSEAGTYEICYGVSACAAADTTLTLAARLHGDTFFNTGIARRLTAGVETPINGSMIVTLPAGAELDLVLSASDAVHVTLGSGVGTFMIVKKLDA